MTFHEKILEIATSRNWAALGINLILSTIIGGIVVVTLLAILSRLWGESVKLPNAFLMVLLINIINLFGILAFLSPYFPSASLFLPAIIWIGFTKAFFWEMAWWHTIVVGIVGFALSIFLIPNLVSAISGFIPSLGI